MTDNPLGHHSNDDIIALVEEVVWASDRTFFQQHPGRQYRLRPAWQVEVEDFVRHGGGAADLCDGHCWWVVVHQMAPGFRYRVPFSAPHHLPTEAPEREARRMFKSLMKGRA
jgi:hypothetical protein